MFETGVGIRNPLFFVGVVERNDDPRLEGRVQVRAFSVHGKNSQVPTTELPWAICASGNYDPNTPPPPLNSFVYGIFLDGREAQHPLILGLIPSQFAEMVDPEKNGWGVIPHKDGNELAKGTTPRDFGQPQNSRLTRGENIHETYVLQQEMSRVENIKIANSEETWEEPSPAYNTVYPYNRVIETSKHVIELDDTPGSERIMIWHKEGSYIQIDSRGTTTHKSASDKFEINDANQHVYVGGKNLVYIDGDSYVKIGGNKVEEIEGDLQTIVHGNYLLGVGGQMNLNASDQIQARGADVKIEANVSTMCIKAAKEIQVESGIELNIKSDFIFSNANYKYEIFSGIQTKITSLIDFDLSASNIFQTATGLVPSLFGTGFNISSSLPVKIGSTLNVDIKAPIVNIDTIINLSNGLSTYPSLAGIVIPGGGAASVQLPEPPYKSTSIKDYKNYGSMGSGGYISASDNTDATLETGD